MNAAEVCRAKCAIYGMVPCVDSARNQPEARKAKGLNPTFTGCPHCHNVAAGEIDFDAMLEETREWVEKSRRMKSA